MRKKGELRLCKKQLGVVEIEIACSLPVAHEQWSLSSERRFYDTHLFHLYSLKQGSEPHTFFLHLIYTETIPDI